MVVDQGFEPCRSSPSDRSPGIIKPRRTTKCCLPLKFVEVGVRFELTVLGICSPLHWATLPSDLWCCWRGLNSRLLPYQGSTLPLSYISIYLIDLIDVFEIGAGDGSRTRNPQLGRLIL